MQYNYDAQGRLAEMPGLGSYGYSDPDHAHAVTYVDGVQKYWYDANSNPSRENTRHAEDPQVPKKRQAHG